MPRAANPPPTVFTLLLCVAVLLIALFLRVHNLLIYPPFIDEAHHILWSSDVYTLHPFTGASNGKLFGLWWMAGFGMYGDGALWLARAASGLFSLIGIAGIYRLGSILVAPWVGLLAALAYALSPFAFFFDRMALVDSYVVGFGILTALFALRYARNGRRADVILCGLALAGAVLAKATGVMLAVIPLLAIVLLAQALPWRTRLRGLGWIYGVLAAIWLPFYAFLMWRGYNYFSTATTVVGTDDTSDLLDRLGDNLRNVMRIDATYLGMAFLLLVGACAVYLVVSRPRVGLLLLLSALLPLAGLMAFATRVSTRYVQFHVPFLVLLIAVGLGLLAQKLWQRSARRQAILPLIALAIWAGVHALPFIVQYWNDPLNVTLPPFDTIEYVAGDSAGFGLPELASTVTTAAHDEGLPVQVIGLISNCEGLRRILPEASQVTVECPYVTIDGGRQGEIAGRVDALAAQAQHTFSLWIALEDDAPYFSLDGITAALERVQIVERPGGLTRMSLHRVVP